MEIEIAYLSNDKDMIKFQYGRKIVRFRGPYSLEYFTSVKNWDNGYMVVMAKYQHNQEPEEEYIDLVPILKNLYIDASQFLKPILKLILAWCVLHQDELMRNWELSKDGKLLNRINPLV